MKKNTVLLVEENLWDAGLVEEALAEIGETQHLRVASREYQMVHVQSMDGALDVLTDIPVDVVLLDLNLPDSKALHSFFRIHSHAPGVPVVILCKPEEEALAVSAVREGAQDYILKDEVDCVPLSRCLNYAIERHQNRNSLPASPTDELTGVYSAESFALLANQSLRLATRLNLAMLVAVADLQPCSQPTPTPSKDSFDRQTEDMALVRTADALRATFDPSAVVARISSLRFAVVALFTDGASAAVMLEHLSAAIECHNQSPARQSNALVRLGSTIIERESLPFDDEGIDPLLQLAASAMAGGHANALATAS